MPPLQTARTDHWQHTIGSDIDPREIQPPSDGRPTIHSSRNHWKPLEKLWLRKAAFEEGKESDASQYPVQSIFCSSSG